MRKTIVLMAMFCCVLVPMHAVAGVPTDNVRDRVNEALEILRDPSLKGDSKKKEKEARIRSVSERMFEFEELSKRTLGAHWKKLSPDQRQEFMSLYKSILEDAYMEKIVAYTDEEVLFEREVPLSEKTAEVRTTVKTKTADVPINYRVIQRDGQWKVYDVVIEGISLINNYRSQFREILSSKTPEDLLDVMRKKVGKA